jgi:Tfp pilus assembly protein PilO
MRFADRKSTQWIAGTLAAGVLLAIAIDVPLRMLQGRHQDRIDRYETELADVPQARARLSTLRDEIAALEAEVDADQKRLPEADEIAQVIRGITNAMQRHAATEPVITTGPTEDLATHSLIPVRVEFDADFISTYRVLESLRAMPRLIRVERLTMTREGDQLGRPVRVELEVAAFFSRPEQYASAAREPMP